MGDVVNNRQSVMTVCVSICLPMPLTEKINGTLKICQCYYDHFCRCCPPGTQDASDDENHDANGNAIAEPFAHSLCANNFTVIAGGNQQVSANMSPHMEMQPEIVPNKPAGINSALPGILTSAVSSDPTSAGPNVPERKKRKKNRKTS